MKIALIQPPYSTDYSKTDEYFKREIEYLDSCDESMDIIVMPELCDVPCLASTREESEMAVEKYNKAFLDKCSETAKRCHAIIFANARDKSNKGYLNTTFAFDRLGNIAGKYYKQHLVMSEVDKLKLDSDYSFEFSEPTVLEIEGLRFGFLVCYDFYFYEAFANMARYNPDAVIGCSHQRSDTHLALEIMSQFLAYNTNAYVLRSSVSMDESSDIGGGSMVVSPRGEILLNMKSRTGIECVEIDIKDKYYKPAGFGNPPAAHHEYIELGRRPWKYRPGGSAIVRDDRRMKYPRVCAHRGFNTVAPENSLPAFGAAVSMGADEIELDLWETADGEIVSVHDHVLDRVSDGTGYVWEHTLDELKKLDFGIKYSAEFEGLKIPTFEEILKKFSCHTVMNIHIKFMENHKPYSERALKKIVDLINKYDCRKYVYFMVSNNEYLARQCKAIAPDIPLCAGSGDNDWDIVDFAIREGCSKVQFGKPDFNRELIEQAHANGIICNVFWSDDPEETKQFLEMGIDTILTNDYNRIAKAVEEYKTEKKL